MATSDAGPEAGGLPTAAAPAVTASAVTAARPPLTIFINYRHEDMPFAASTLYRELKGRFGQQSIFFDGGTLQPGMQFLEAIKSHLSGTPGAFLALIGPDWLPTMDAHQRQGDDDYVATEIELGLQHGWTVIPVLLNDARLPARDHLPRAIRELPGYHVAHLRQTSLDDDIDRLAARLDEISTRPADEAETGDGSGLTAGPSNGSGTDSVVTPDVPPAGDEHYQDLIDEADNLVIFLGAGANADDHDGPFRPGAAMLPDDTDLAEYLAVKVRLKSEQRELAEVAQYARMIRGEPRVFRWVRSMFVDSEPGPIHRYLAGLPRRLDNLGLEKRYQMIVTSKFDVALEQAFVEINEPFDVALYMAPGTEHAGRFVHLKWRSNEPEPILVPNSYNEFPIVGDDSQLTRTVIVRINGAIDDSAIGYTWKNNYVITEDHYIDYFGRRPAEEVVPMQILTKLRQASCLFLGYTLADWRLRVFLRWIWPGERPSGATHWAVERSPDILERRFWQHNGVGLYRSRLTDYVQGFDRFLVRNRDELQ